MQPARYLRVTNTDRAQPLVNQPSNLNTMPQRYSRIVSNLLNATQHGATQMARVTTRAERHCEEGVERGWWRRRRRKDRVQACVPFSWKRPRGIVHAAYIQTNNGSTGTRVCENIYSGRLLLSVCPNKSLEWTSIWSRAFS